MRLLTGTLVGFVVGGFFSFEPFGVVEEWSIDLRLRARGNRPMADEVRLVGINDGDLENLGRWPLPRGVHADALRVLGALSAKGVVCDILFLEPSADPSQDDLLRQAAGGLGSFTMPYFFQTIGGQDPSHFIEGQRYGVPADDASFIRAADPVKPLAGLGSDFGAANVLPDPGDEIIRRVPMFFKTGDRLYPGLAMQALIRILQAQPDQVRIHPGRLIEIVDTPRGIVRIPIDKNGNFRVNYLGNLDSLQPAFSYSDLYLAVEDKGHAALMRDEIKGRTVIVGDVSTGSADIVTTPIGRMPGMAVQLTALSNILDGRFLFLPPSWLTVLCCALLGLGFATVFRTTRIIPGILVTIGCLAIVIAGSLWAARHDVMFPLTAACGTIAIAASSLTALQSLHFRLAEKRIRDALAPFVDNKVFAHALENEEAPRRSSERRELSILFSDIRGFTRWTEKQEADEVTRTLNEYFSAMVPIVGKFGGTMDKLIGDGMMVFAGAPDEVANHALVAVRIAWAMQREVARLNEKFSMEARDRFGIGIGIHSGFVTVGHFGSEHFQDYTVIGRAVNLASHIESVCPAGKILITPRTRALAGPAVKCRPFGEVQLDGVADQVELLEVIGVNDVDSG
jgi:adenylate cyclase